jgi:hypothetical protein
LTSQGNLYSVEMLTHNSSCIRMKAILVVSALTGFTLHNPTRQIASVALDIYSYFVIFLISIFAALSTARAMNAWSESSHSLANFIFSSRTPLLAIVFVFQTTILQLRRKKLQGIFRDLHKLSENDFILLPDFQKHVRRASKRTFNVYFLLPFTLSNGILLALTALSVTAALGLYKDELFERNVNEVGPKIFETVDVKQYLMILLVYTLANLKNVSQDAILLYSYAVTTEQTALLRGMLDGVKLELHTPFKTCSSLDSWIKYQQTLAR